MHAAWEARLTTHRPPIDILLAHPIRAQCPALQEEMGLQFPPNLGHCSPNLTGRDELQIFQVACLIITCGVGVLGQYERVDEWCSTTKSWRAGSDELSCYGGLQSVTGVDM